MHCVTHQSNLQQQHQQQQQHWQPNSSSSWQWHQQQHQHAVAVTAVSCSSSFTARQGQQDRRRQLQRQQRQWQQQHQQQHSVALVPSAGSPHNRPCRMRQEAARTPSPVTAPPRGPTTPPPLARCSHRHNINTNTCMQHLCIYVADPTQHLPPPQPVLPAPTWCCSQ
jgi:hypothetical protein